MNTVSAPSRFRLAIWAIVLAAPTVARGDGSGDVKTYAVPDGGRAVTARTDADGAIHLLYDTADGPRYAKSTDNGVTFSTPLRIVDSASFPKGLEFTGWDLAVGKGGIVHVAVGTNAWKLKRPEEEWGYYYARLEFGAKSFSPVRNINQKPSEGFSLAADDNGNVTACWMSGKLYANVSHDGGKTFGPNTEIDRKCDPCNCCTTSATYGEDGRLAVLYREETNNERDMYLILWDQARGKTTRTRVGSTPWMVNTCPMTYYSIVRDRDGFVLAWPTKGDIYFARVDGSGTPRQQSEIKTPGRNGMRTGLVALSAPNGHTFVAWKKDSQLGWQVFDAKGLAVGKPGTAASPGAGVAGVVDKAGRFVLIR
jgi:hypothetical protein